MTALSNDERAVLNVFANATEPLDWGNVVESLLPPRPRGPRRGGKRTWKLRWEEMVRTAMELYKAGLLAELPTGPADMTVITDAGREALWGPKPSGCHGSEQGYAPCVFQGVDGLLAGQPARRRWWRR